MPRRILEGNVVSAKNNKTITVLVERRFMHPVYKKYVKSTGKYTAHDEANSCQEGDRVSIIECRPVSKSKRWTLVTDADSAKKEEPKKPAAKKAAPKKDVKAEEKPVAKKKAPAKKSAAKKETKAKKKDA
ncbi:MAG: 30S ribosomal protein S17 [Alphaproteobacteria bacterium]